MKLARGIFATALLAAGWVFLPVIVTLALAVAGITWYVRHNFGLNARRA